MPQLFDPFGYVAWWPGDMDPGDMRMWWLVATGEIQDKSDKARAGVFGEWKHCKNVVK